MTNSVRKSKYDAVCRERDELAAKVERLSGQLRAFRKWIEKQEVDAFGVVEETHDCPAYPIRDELIYEITKTINEIPAQSLANIRAEAVEALLEAWRASDESERWHTISPEWVKDYAQQIRSGER